MRLRQCQRDLTRLSLPEFRQSISPLRHSRAGVRCCVSPDQRSLHMRARVLFICIAIIGFATTLPAQDKDVEGAKDHPMVSRFPGYVISDYDAQDFSSYEFYVGQGGQKVEGRYWKIE